MNSIQKKSTLATAILVALNPMGNAAWADPVAGIRIMDVGSVLNGVNGGGGSATFSPILDGHSGGFRFSPINPTTWAGVSDWTGDVGTGTILGQGAANPTGSFSTGFLFSGAPFAPYTFGSNVSADITVDNAGNTALVVNTFDFGGNYGPGQNFNLPPDAGTLNSNFVERGAAAGEFLVNFQWAHDITTAEDPSLNFTTFTARWILEGTATVIDSAPKIFINDTSGSPSPLAGDVVTEIGATTNPYVDTGAVCQDVVDGNITGSVTNVITPNPPPTSNIGDSFTVTYTCTDSQSNVATATRTVNVTSDTQPPVITLGVGPTESGRSDSPDGSVVDILVGVLYVDAGATCTDNFDGLIGTVPPDITGSPSFVVTPNPPVVSTSAPSTGNLITFTCTDTNANVAQAQRTVNVVADNQPPVITLLGANPLTVAVGSVYTDPGATCVDTNPIDPDPVDISANLDINPTTINTSTTGTYTVTYNCSDASGNAAPQQTRTVNVAQGQNYRIISMTITDLDGDGLAGCFKFNSLDPTTCAGANFFSSDDSGNAGTAGSARIPGIGADVDANGNPLGVVFGRFQPITQFIDPAPPGVNTQAPLPVGPISPGFLFTSFPFVPTTFDPNAQTGGVNPEVATPTEGFVTVTGSTSALLTMQSLPFGGLFNSNKPNYFFLDPDEGTFSGTITQVNNDDNGTTRTFNYAMTWNHLITNTEDPTGQFPGFDAFWRLEGVVTTESAPFTVNNPPAIQAFNAVQDARNPTTIITADGGPVAVTVTAEDPDGNGLTYDWSQSAVQPVGPTDQPVFSFDPSNLKAGPVALVVVVGDDTAEPLTVTGNVILNVQQTAPTLSDTEDSDGDGIPDATEGFGDEDFDGIANYQDPIDGNTEPGRNRVDFSNPSRGDIVASVGRLRLGSTATSVGDGTFLVTEQNIAQYGGPAATPTNNSRDLLNNVKNVGPIPNGIRDFVIDDLNIGATVQIVIPQDQPLPAVPTYRKYTADTGWIPFSTVSGNALASAPKVNGVCPAPSDPAYDTPVDPNSGQTIMVAGDECVRLTIVDGGGNDADRTRNGVISDPGTVSSDGTASSASSSSGCTLGTSGRDVRGDWWLIVVSLLGLFGFKRRKTNTTPADRRA